MAVLSFSKSKYVNPAELASFSAMLKQTIAKIQSVLNISPFNKKDPVVMEAWVLFHHITCGERLLYTSPSLQLTIKFWIGLDLFEAGIALVVWFEEPDPAVISHLFTLRNKGCCGELGRYQQGEIDEAWIALNDASFSQFLSTPAQEPQIIEDFLREVLNGL